MTISSSNMKSKYLGVTVVEILVLIAVTSVLVVIGIVFYKSFTARTTTEAEATARGNTAINIGVVDSIRQQAELIYATTNTYPAASSTPATALANLTYTSYPLVLSRTGATVSSVSSTGDTTFSYRTKGSPATGFCVGYWASLNSDSSPATPTPVYIYGGDATTDNGTICS